MGKNSSGLIEVIGLAITGIAGFLLLSFFGNFVTKADYSPDNFVSKETYLTDVSVMKTEINYLKVGQETISKDVKDILKEVKK